MMERSSYGFYTKRSEILDNIQKKKDQDKDEPPGPGSGLQPQQPGSKPEKAPPDGGNQPAQHAPAQQLLSPTHGAPQSQPVQPKDDPKDKPVKVANSTTITLIENGNVNDKDKEPNYSKNYFTLEPKSDKKDEGNKNSITITRTAAPKQSPGGQTDKNKGTTKPTKRPLQCLETLAEKAGITFEDKYEAANTLLALDKQNSNFRRPELKQPKSEPESNNEEYRYRNQKEEDDKLQIQQQIIQQQQQQQLQQLQQHQLQFQQLQQQALQRQHQQAIQQHLKNQQDQQDLLQKQFQQQQQQKSEHQQVSQQNDLQQQHQKFLQVVNNQPVHTQHFNVPGIGEINLSFLASPQQQQGNVNLVFDKNQKPGMSNDIKPQQLVDGQQATQQQMGMSQHEPSQQHHQTVTVVSSMPSSMAHQQSTPGMQQQSSMQPMQSMPPNTPHPQQLSAEWGHSRVQVIQQPLQNNTYLQQLYNAQGPLLMPGNIALHPGINSQQIQVIAAGKPFQGNQIAPHMLATQGKQVLQGQAAPFPGYTTIPTIPTTQNQTFVFSPLGVINSQPNILPVHSQSNASMGQQQKQPEMHKVMSNAGGNKLSTSKAVGAGAGGGGQQVPVQAQCVQVSQPVLGTQQPQQAQIISPLQTGGQTMQFAPWQISGALPQMWTSGLPAGALPTGQLLAPNPIFIRGSQPDSSPSMFIQHSPQNSLQHNATSVSCATSTISKPRAAGDGMAKPPRPLSTILPSTGIRPASSVSTQTSTNQQNQAKNRGKLGVRQPAPAAKQDAANQTNKMQHQMQPPKQQLLVMNSAGQMTQITSVQDNKQPIKSMQQQALMQQQMQVQQQQQAQQQQQQAQQQQQQAQQQVQQQVQQQQQLLHQQQQTQMVQHYQHQGIALGMQQGLQGSMAQALPMQQTISMVQQIHPLGSMPQGGTLVGQLTTAQAPQGAAMTQTMQQQPQQTLVSSGLVQTSMSNMGMAMTQPTSMMQPAPMQTPALGVDGAFLAAPLMHLSPMVLQHEVAPLALSLPPVGTASVGVGVGVGGTQMVQMNMGLLPAPAPSPTLIAHVKSQDDKLTMPPPPAPVQQIAPQPPPVSTADPTPAFSAPSPTPVATSAPTPVSAPAPVSAPTTVPAPAPVSVPAPVSAPAPVPATTTVSTATEPPKPPQVKTESTGTSMDPPSSPIVPRAAPVVTSSARHPTTVTPQVVTTVAATTTPTITMAITAPVSTNSLFKSSSCSPRHSMSQATQHDKGLPKAMVKPNILTHVIEGYVIQEAAEPFAVNRPVREWGMDKEDKENKLPSSADEPPRKKQLLDSAGLSRITSSVEGEATAKAEPEAARNAAAADGANRANGAPAKLPIAHKWTVAEVCEFIRSIPGCAGYADEFLMQEVDGEALLLIRPEHLVMALSMKLGPALKIVACIDALRPEGDHAVTDNE